MIKMKSDYKLDFDDVMLVPKPSSLNSRKDVLLSRTFKFKNGKSISCVPIVAANMDTVGTFSMCNVLSKFNLLTALHKHYSIERLQSFINTESSHFFYTVGIDDREFGKFYELYKCHKQHKNIPILLNIDIANGYISKMTDTVKKYRDMYPEIVICAGNVVTPEGINNLAKAGADIIKLGIGSGAMCLTRAKAGVGYPQFSCIVDCNEAADENDVYIMSDGGCKNPGDICKAFAAGSDFVMLGSMLAGHDESEVDFLIDENGSETCLVYGMSSDSAMQKYNGGDRNYRSSEGRSVILKRRGPIDNTIRDILGGLRSCATYINALSISEFPAQAEFVKVYRQLNTSLGK